MDSPDSLEGLGHAVRLDVRVPVLLPAVALPTHLALERLQAHVLVHVLLEIFGFVEPLVTAAGTASKHVKHIVAADERVTRRRETSGDSLRAGERTDVGFGLVLLQVFAESRGSVERCATRVA